MHTEAHLKILKYLESNPEASQRQLAQELDVSVGKVNYCLKALIAKGFMKAGNFKRNTQKLSYLYPRIQLASAIGGLIPNNT